MAEWKEKKENTLKKGSDEENELEEEENIYAVEEV